MVSRSVQICAFGQLGFLSRVDHDDNCYEQMHEQTSLSFRKVKVKKGYLQCDMQSLSAFKTKWKYRCLSNMPFSSKPHRPQPSHLRHVEAKALAIRQKLRNCANPKSYAYVAGKDHCEACLGRPNSPRTLPNTNPGAELSQGYVQPSLRSVR